MKVKSVEIAEPGNIRITEKEVDFGVNPALFLECSAISPLDQQISQGYFPLANKWPLVPGTSGVAIDSKGSRYFVFAEGAGGGFNIAGVHQEAFSFPKEYIFPIPDGISSETVAITMISFLSVFSIFSDIKNGSNVVKVLVLGANGSIGEAALLVAEHLGLQATGVTREGTKVLVRETLTYNDLSATSGESGFNLVIDTLGGPFTKLAARFAEPGCKCVVVGLGGGISIEIDGAELLGSGYRVEGFNLLRVPLSEISQSVRKTFDLLKNSYYEPRFEKKLSLSSGVEAYALAMNSRQRVLLTR